MKIIALVEVHPLSGEPSFITARFTSDRGDFDMPLNPDQAEIILQHTVSPEEIPADTSFEEALTSDEQEFPPSSILPSFPDLDDDALVIDNTTAPSSYYSNNMEYDDDEL